MKARSGLSSGVQENITEENPKMTADLRAKEYESAAVLYMAMELSNKTWRLAFGDGRRARQVRIDAGDIAALGEQIGKAKVRVGRGSWGGELLRGWTRRFLAAPSA